MSSGTASWVGLFAVLSMGAGCERPADVPSEVDSAQRIDDDVSEHLRALGYVGWDEDADASLSGVIVHDGAAVAPGANLYTNDVDTVFLIDNQGATLRSWELPGRTHCEHAEALADGRLAVLCEREVLVVLRNDGTVVLEVPGDVHHDVAEMQDGSLLVPVRDKARLYRGRSVIFDSILEISPDGDTRTVWSTYDALEDLSALHESSELDKLPSPRILAHYAKSWVLGRPINRHDYYHLNAVEVLGDTPLGRVDQRFRQGNLLISLRNVDILVILDRETLKPVWHWGGGVLELPHDPTWLDGGQLLVFDNGTRRGYSRVLEVDPPTGDILWSYPAEGEQSLFSEWRGSSQRLPGGNTLICESEKGRVLEVTPDGRVVWEFWNPEIGEKGRKRIYRFKRLRPELSRRLLAEHPSLVW